MEANLMSHIILQLVTHTHRLIVVRKLGDYSTLVITSICVERSLLEAIEYNLLWQLLQT
jgi:hypothetical protein